MGVLPVKVGVGVKNLKDSLHDHINMWLWVAYYPTTFAILRIDVILVPRV